MCLFNNVNDIVRSFNLLNATVALNHISKIDLTYATMAGSNMPKSMQS